MVLAGSRRRIVAATVAFALSWSLLAAAPAPAARAAEATLPGGAGISVDITEPADAGADPSGGVTLRGRAAVGEGDGPGDTTLVYVLDVSTSSILYRNACGGDANGDRLVDTVLDCQIAAAVELNREAARSGAVAEVGVVVFALRAAIADVGPAPGQQTLTGPATDDGGQAGADVEQVLRSLRSGFFNEGVDEFTRYRVGPATNFSAGLTSACDALAASTSGNNVVAFLSDGETNRGSHVSAVLPCAPAATVHTFAVGSGAACDRDFSRRGSLQDIADLTGGTCTDVVDVDELPDILPGIARTQLTGLTLSVDGGEPVDVSASATPALPVDGPGGVDFEHTLADLGPGSHELCVTAHGRDAGGEGSVTDCVTVQANRAPVADAGPDVTVDEGGVVRLDGGGSHDPDGDPLSLRWRLVDRLGPPVALSAAGSATPSFVASDDGSYTFELTVSDGQAADSDTVTVTVGNLAPEVSAEAHPGQAGGVSLVTATFTDPGWLDVHEASVDFGDGSAPVPAPVTAGAGWGTAFASHVYGGPGVYEVTVSVTDDDGGVGRAVVAAVEVGEPVALWAGSQQAERTIDWSGGDGRVSGRVHSNNELRVRGSTKQVTGTTTYAGSLSADTDRHVFEPPPAPGAVEEPPVAFDLADYRPGGRAAVEAGRRYHDRSSECDANGVWHATNTVLDPGLYYVACDAKVNGSAVGGTVTVVAEGSVEVAGSRPAFEPFVDGLLFLSGGQGRQAVKVAAADSKFLGFVSAPGGGVEVSGNDNRFVCGIVADTIDLSGSRFVADAADCTRPERTVAASLLVPDLAVALAGGPEAAIPGDDVGYDVQVSNSGARLVLPGVVGAENVDAVEASLAHWSYQVEYFSLAEQRWVALAGAAGTAGGYEPTDPPATADGVVFRATANPTEGVVYPDGPDPLTGATLAPGALASWGYQAVVDLDPDSAALLLDPARVGAVRHAVSFEFTPAATQVRRLYRFGHDVAGELRAQGAGVEAVEVTVVDPVGDAHVVSAADEPALAGIAPGGSATVPAGYAVPVPAPRGAHEPAGAYLDRLADADGARLRTFAYARAAGGVGQLVAPQIAAAVVQRLPVLRLSADAPAEATAGSTLDYDLRLRNGGSAAAGGIGVAHRVDGEPVDVSGVPTTLEAGELATAAAAWPLSHDHPGGPVHAEADASWLDGNGNPYGPATASATTAVASAGQLVATQVATVAVDADGSGLPSPGDTLRYRATVTNRGGSDVTGVVFSATPDANTALVAGSVTTTQGTVTRGGADGDTSVAVGLGAIAAGAAATVAYDVVVSDPFPDDARSVAVQGLVTADGLAPVVTDDPAGPGSADPTRTWIVVPVARLAATMTASLAVDGDGDGLAGPGDTLAYEVFLHNEGSAPVDGAVLEVRLDPHTALVDGSPTTTQGSVVADDGSEENPADVVVDLGTITGLSTATVTLRARVDDPLPGDVDAVLAQGVVRSDTLDPVPTDDPQVAGDSDPTSTAISRPAAPPAPGPTFEALTPADGQVVTAPVEVRAALTPPDGGEVAGWRVSYRRVGSGTDVELAAGDGPPVDAGDGADPLLAVFDPTVVPNGTYVLTVEATATGGGSTVSHTGLVVDGQLKPGRYVVTFDDLDVQLGGLPIAVRRTYDSLDAAGGDFGPGWSLELASLRASTSRPLGQGGWSQRIGVCGLVFCIVEYETSVPHVVTVTWPDGRQELFDLTPLPGSTFFRPLTSAAYTGRPGATSRLEPVEGDGSLTYLDDGNLYGGAFGGEGIYDPKRFRLVARDGTAYLIDRDRGLLSVTDPRGDTLTVGRDGITSSRGPAVAFARDDAGRITTVTGPDGASVGYGYDPGGRLTAVTDPHGDTTAYGYDADGTLSGIRDGLGRAFRTLEYDADGRLVAVTDATGARTTIERDVDARTEVVTDAEGRLTTVTTFDERGNVLRVDEVFDGLTRTTEFAYDGLDNRTLRRDPAGNEWRAVYDGRDLVALTDPQGAVTRLSYDPAGRPTQWRDADGHATGYDWNPDGTLAAIVDPLGHAETYAYEDGNRVARTDRAGNTWTYRYDPFGRRTAETDPTGATRGWDYDDAGRVVAATDPLGGRTAYSYDPAGRLVARTDPAGATTRWAYDAAGQTVARTDAAGHVTAWGYDPAGRLVAETDPTGAETGYAYDRNGRLVATTDPAGGVTGYRHDGAGQLSAQSDPLGRVTRYAYDPTGRLVAVTDPAGGTTGYRHDRAGRLVAATDPTGAETVHAYSARGDLLATTDPLGRRTAYDYDPAGRVVATTWPDGTGTTSAYDPAGRLAATVDEAGRKTVFGYDAAGRRTEVTDALGRTSGSTYDAAGRLVAQRDPLGNSTSFAYDPAGRLVETTSAEGVTTTHVYDRRGLRVATRDGLGHTTTVAYDAAGRPVAETDALGRATTTAYDPAGRVAAVSDALGGTVSFGYDAAGQRTHLTDANGQTWTTAYGPAGAPAAETDPLGRTRRWTYDAAGRLAAVSDARGVTVGYRYDAAGQLVAVEHPDGQVGFAYDARGRRSRMTDDTGVTRWRHDPTGRVVEVASPQGTVGYAYDAAGQRVAMTQPEGTVAYDHDAAGRLAALTGLDGATTTFGYDRDGRLVAVARPNGVDTTRRHDGAGRLVGVAHRGGGVDESFAYSLDAAGNRIAVASTDGVESYELDAVDRLVGVGLPDGGRLEFAYDAAGNRVRETRGGVAVDSRYDAAGQLVDAGGRRFAYDAAGNRTAAGDDRFVWDWAGRLVAADVGGVAARYRYDGDGLRVAADVDGAASAFVHDRAGGLPTVISDGQAGYTHAGGAPLAAYDDDVSYLLGDALGSVRAVADAAGAVTATAAYEPFGAPRTAGDVGRFGFAGEAQDVTGLVHLRARDLDPASGTFLSVDPVRPGAPGVVGYNPYSYVANNPTTWTDPSGAFVAGEYAILLKNTTVRSAPPAAAVGLGLRWRLLALAALLSQIPTDTPAPAPAPAPAPDPDPTPTPVPVPVPIPAPGPDPDPGPPDTDEDDGCDPQAVAAWKMTLRSDPETSTEDWAHYQRQVAGPMKYVAVGGGTAVEADGIRETTCSLLDAKYVGDPDRSPYVHDSLSPDYVRGSVMTELRGQFTRYGMVIGDASTPVTNLEVITNEARAVSTFQALMAELGVPGQVVLRPALK